MKILYELSWLWETLGIALVAAAVCMACAALICKAARKKLSIRVLAIIGGYSDRPDADAALIGRSVCRKRMRLGKEFTKQIGSCGGMNIWQMRITNLARNLTFAMS